MKNFCVDPWYSTEISLRAGTEHVCCWMEGNLFTTREDVQQQFIATDRPAVCNKCWKTEDLGQPSRRKTNNTFLDFAYDLDIENIEKEALAGNNYERAIMQLQIGSICNGMCTTCNTEFSSAWRQLEGEPRLITTEQHTVQDNYIRLVKETNWSKVKRITLFGGEPLLIKQTYDILTHLFWHSNTDCVISLVTNGSITPTQTQQELIKKFTNLNVCVSIDGVGKAFEYIRYPLKWDAVDANIKLYKELFNDVSIVCTLSNLNANAQLDVVNWASEMGLTVQPNIVQYPEYFRTDVKPGHEIWPAFVAEIERQDNLKNINIRDYLPEVGALIDGKG